MRSTTSPVDWLALVLLLVIIITAIIPTIAVNLVGSGYDYRQTVGVVVLVFATVTWFRGLFIGQPDVAAMRRKWRRIGAHD